MKKNIVLLGLGGQGILFAGKILAHAASLAGYQTSYLPFHGQEVQNGKVRAEVIISDNQIFHPFIEESDYTLVFHKFRIDDAKKISNSSSVIFLKDFSQSLDTKTFFVDTEKLQDKNKVNISSNIIMIGALLSQIENEITIDDKSINEALKQELIHKPFSTVTQNFKAYKQGRSFKL